jgi:hypothetical protein
LAVQAGLDTSDGSRSPLAKGMERLLSFCVGLLEK